MIYETRQLAAVVELGSKEQDPVTFPMAKCHMRKALKSLRSKAGGFFALNVCLFLHYGILLVYILPQGRGAWAIFLIIKF